MAKSILNYSFPFVSETCRFLSPQKAGVWCRGMQGAGPFLPPVGAGGRVQSRTEGAAAAPEPVWAEEPSAGLLAGSCTLALGRAA